MTEVRMKNLLRMHIHPDVWLGLSLEVVKDIFENEKPDLILNSMR